MATDQLKISGHRELSKKEIDLMNQIKALGPAIESVIVQVATHLLEQQAKAEFGPHYLRASPEQQRLMSSDPQKWLSEGTTTLQTGLMQLTRSVAQPTFF